MKKFLLIIYAIILVLTLSSCFKTTTYPNMIEYEESEVLKIAKEKYSLESFLFTDKVYHGVASIDEKGNFSIESYSSSFSTTFLEGDNIETAFTSFAGKNGGHDIQGMYRNFLCYVALGIDAEGNGKFVYYNINLDKDAVIKDTIGCSYYMYDVLPNEITNEVLTHPDEWVDMAVYMDKNFKNRDYPLNFSKERLSYGYHELNGYVYFEFYKENNEIVYDLMCIENIDKNEEPKLIYSTSNRYFSCYNYYGLDISEYVDVSYTVERSKEGAGMDLLSGNIMVRPVNGTIIYSQLTVETSYKGLIDNQIISIEQRLTHRFTTEVKTGALMDRIPEVDHSETAYVKCIDFYVLYEKIIEKLEC